MAALCGSSPVLASKRSFVGLHPDLQCPCPSLGPLQTRDVFVVLLFFLRQQRHLWKGFLWNLVYTSARNSGISYPGLAAASALLHVASARDGEMVSPREDCSQYLLIDATGINGRHGPQHKGHPKGVVAKYQEVWFVYLPDQLPYRH